MTGPLHIVELRAQNVKRLRAVTVRPDADGSMVVLAGRNGAGKSSVLDAIAMALGGRDQIPAEPIRRGEERAEVVVDLGELIVRRTFTPGGGGQLVVSNRDGARFTSPQTMLDALVGRLTFDPLEFAREKPARQAEILRELVGLDLTSIDAERDARYAERTEVNRRTRSLASRLDAMPRHPDAPADPVDVAELADAMRAADKLNAENARKRKALEQWRRDGREIADRRDNLRAKIEELEAQLADTIETLAHHDRQQVEREAEVAGLQDIDTAPILQQIRDAEAINRKVRENHARQDLEVERQEAENEADKLTRAIESLDQRRADAIAAAPMPVPGLGFGPDGTVTLNGIPLEQASAGERLRVSVAIGLAANPRLRVLLVRDAALLDADSMRMLAQMARDAGAQLWVERVESDAKTTIVIEDGEVAGATCRNEPERDPELEHARRDGQIDHGDSAWPGVPS